MRQVPTVKQDYLYFEELKTRWRDSDVYGHINNAVFLSYFEDARKSFFKRWDINLTDRSLIVASIKIDYLQQVKHPSQLDVGQKVSRLGNTSFDIFSILFLDNKPICSATTTIVCYNFLTEKKIKLLDEIKNDYNK